MPVRSGVEFTNTYHVPGTSILSALPTGSHFIFPTTVGEHSGKVRCRCWCHFVLEQQSAYLFICRDGDRTPRALHVLGKASMTSLQLHRY
jgi:hypothetical protein